VFEILFHLVLGKESMFGHPKVDRENSRSINNRRHLFKGLFKYLLFLEHAKESLRVLTNFPD
jgi:hypothetical protein